MDPLHWRYATKKFDPSRKISKPEFEEILEALRLSPSSFGLQPWKFIVIHDPDLRKRLRPYAWDQAQLTDADCVIVFCSLKTMDEKYVQHYIDHAARVRGVTKESLSDYEQKIMTFLKSQDTHQIAASMKNQVHIALGVFLAECAHRKIDTCPIGGFDPQKFDEILGLSSLGLESVVVCAVGYRASDDQYAQLRKVRFTSKEIFVDRS